MGNLPLPFAKAGDGAITGQFSYSIDGVTFHPLGSPFDVHPGRWIGARFGLFCVEETDSETGLSPEDRQNTYLAVHSFHVRRPPSEENP